MEKPLNARVKPTNEWVEVKRTDKTGNCFKHLNHYYRQDSDKVLHVTDKLINILEENHIEDMRANWQDTFEEISKEEFKVQLQKTITSFYD